MFVREVKEFIPQHEVQLRRVVAPEEFLDTLFWGRSDPKAALLLERALEEQRQREHRQKATENTDLTRW